MKLRLLDLFCGAGGAAMGYHRAGFEVVGVDIKPQPRYPFEFHQADAFEWLEEYCLASVADRLLGRQVNTREDARPIVAPFDAIHASPPCRDHTALKSRAGRDGTAWILEAIRERLQASDVPWIIENVPGAPMRRDLTLCGSMFGLRTYRHRWFELSFLALEPGHPSHPVKTSTKKRRACWDVGMHVSVTGDVGVYVGRQAMGIDWMTGNELSQAIPPDYTEWIGRQLLAHLRSVLREQRAE